MIRPTICKQNDLSNVRGANALLVKSCRRVRAGCPFRGSDGLFTDIEGSTRRWEADADGMRTALAHLREVLGDQTYESLARKGSTMTAPGIAVYALDQIEQARAGLNVVSE